MNGRTSILDSLTESVVDQQTEADFIKAAGQLVKKVAPVAAFVAPIALALSTGKKPASRLARPDAAIQYAKLLTKAKTNQESVAAVVGLLNICAHILLGVPELRTLGHKISQVVMSNQLEDFF